MVSWPRVAAMATRSPGPNPASFKRRLRCVTAVANAAYDSTPPRPSNAGALGEDNAACASQARSSNGSCCRGGVLYSAFKSTIPRSFVVWWAPNGACLRSW